LKTRMIEEALEAPDRVAQMLEAQREHFDELSALLRRQLPPAVVTIARGSSDHAASFFAYLCMLRSGRLVTSLPMSLLTIHDAPIRADGMLALAISQSGQSPDVRVPMQRLRAGGTTTVALVNDTASPLAEAAEWVVPLGAGPERSVAATKSFICSLVAGALLIARWCEDHPLLAALHELPTFLRTASAQNWAAGVDALRDAQRIMVIGRGTGLAIAQEAALKFKETCGIQAEAFSSAEVKHGPMALVQKGYPMLVFAPRGPAQADLLAVAREMRQRGARVLLAAPADVADRELTLTTTLTADLDPIAAVQSFYGMVEALARARGNDPDRPRHLQKVTSTL
jgi:glucosamine--fructose-6-phosphate aminotransferase (isomerizing)